MNPFISQDILPISIDSFSSVETVAILFSVNTGSLNEFENELGISHFVEHMLFKGTKQRTAFDIANQIDSIGGYINAYTSKQSTVYYVKLLKENLQVGMEVLSDMLQNSVFNFKDIESEKEVVLQELYASMDDHDDLSYDMFANNIFKGSSISRNILGTKDSISNFQKNHLDNYLKRRYTNNNSILSISGNVDVDLALKYHDKYFSNFHSTEVKNNVDYIFNSGFNVNVNDKIEQSKLFIGYKSVSFSNLHDLYLSHIVSNILSGGMSSRLFQEIREKRGLVYSIYSFNENYEDLGIFGIYAATTYDKLQELSTVILSEIEKAADDLKEEERIKTVNQYKVSLANMLENPVSRATKIANDYHCYKKYILIDEIKEIIENISLNEIKDFIKNNLLKQDPSLFIYTNKEIDKSLNCFQNYFKN